MSIISKETWDKFTQEEKEKVRRDYQVAIETGNGKVIYELENLFGKENLNPQPLTYRDVARELFEGKRYYIPNGYFDNRSFEEKTNLESKVFSGINCITDKQGLKIIAINKLLNVAKFLNKDWKPDWENNEEPKWYLWDFPGKRPIPAFTAQNNSCIVYFRTEELAEQAVAILGEDMVRLALTTEY